MKTFEINCLQSLNTEINYLHAINRNKLFAAA